jgi:outer membrane protein assembly factor BamB
MACVTTSCNPDQLIATQAFTGEILWQVPLNLPPEVSSSSIFPQPPEWDDDLLVRNGRVLVHTTSFKEGDEQPGYFNFQAFDALTGSVVWQVVGQAHGTVIYDETRVYLIYTDEFVDYDAFGDLTIPLHIHAHDLSTGQELGTQTLALPAASGGCLLLNNPATNLLGNVPYDTWLNAYSLETGKPLWSTEILLENPISIAALGQDTILLSWGGQLRAYAITP